jgi:hypothetical protein
LLQVLRLLVLVVPFNEQVTAISARAVQMEREDQVVPLTGCKLVVCRHGSSCSINSVLTKVQGQGKAEEERGKA